MQQILKIQFHSLETHLQLPKKKKKKTHLQIRIERHRIRRRFNSSEMEVEIQFLADETQVALPTPRSQYLPSRNAASK
jgi:hypothetical protein